MIITFDPSRRNKNPDEIFVTQLPNEVTEFDIDQVALFKNRIAGITKRHNLVIPPRSRGGIKLIQIVALDYQEAVVGALRALGPFRSASWATLKDENAFRSTIKDAQRRDLKAVAQEVVLLDLFAVSESHNRQGIGTALIESFEKTCKEKGIKIILAFIDEPNPVTKRAAIDFYLKKGFEITEDILEYSGVSFRLQREEANAKLTAYKILDEENDLRLIVDDLSVSHVEEKRNIDTPQIESISIKILNNDTTRFDAKMAALYKKRIHGVNPNESSLIPPQDKRHKIKSIRMVALDGKNVLGGALDARNLFGYIDKTLTPDLSITKQKKLRESLDVIWAEVVFLSLIAVEETWSGVGVGSKMLQELDIICRSKSVKVIIGFIDEDDIDKKNRIAKFYTKNGYKVTTDKLGYDSVSFYPEHSTVNLSAWTVYKILDADNELRRFAETKVQEPIKTKTELVEPTAVIDSSVEEGLVLPKLKPKTFFGWVMERSRKNVK